MATPYETVERHWFAFLDQLANDLVYFAEESNVREFRLRALQLAFIIEATLFLRRKS